MTTQKIDQPPPRLFKYRTFSSNTLEVLAQHRVYYSDPTLFNDPLDCKPLMSVDEDTPTIEQLTVQMAGEHEGKEIIELCKFSSDELIGDGFASYKRELVAQLKVLLDKDLSRNGVLSLAERWDCPLMWSHYADAHKGLCIEFDTSLHKCMRLKPINYQGSRSIKLSDLVAWKLESSAVAKQRIFDTYFFAKSEDWSYEKEWRDIKEPRGTQESPLVITGIYFGLRCEPIIESTVMKLLIDAEPKPTFYRIKPQKGEFKLDRVEIDPDEVSPFATRTPSWWDFRNIIAEP